MKKIKYIVRKIVRIFFISLITIFLYKCFIKIENNNIEDEIFGTKLSADEENNENINNISDIIENASKCVVGISKIKTLGSSVFTSNSSEELGLGSGIIISKKGYILTNQHVVGESKKCYVTTEDGKSYTGEILWKNVDVDLAILKVEEYFNNIINIGDSNSVRIGEEVYAIGNPIGYEFQRTVTGGIISAINRTVKIKNEDETYSYMSNLIQTDATINPGNSGGPLINKEGELVGINTIKITSAEGIGFAIPINIVKPIIDKYEKTGEFKEAYLGIFAYDGSVISYINKDKKVSEGIYVESIIENSPAYNTELKPGDNIIRIDNTSVNKLSELQQYIFTKNSGDEIILTVMRNNKEKKIKVILK